MKTWKTICKACKKETEYMSIQPFETCTKCWLQETNNEIIHVQRNKKLEEYSND